MEKSENGKKMKWHNVKTDGYPKNTNTDDQFLVKFKMNCYFTVVYFSKNKDDIF